MKFYFIIGCLLFTVACSNIQEHQRNSDAAAKMALTASQSDFWKENVIQTENTLRTQIVGYAKTLIGTPYKYASTDPGEGFDCSGFITYVFNHFKIQVPRSSVDFTNAYPEVPVARATAGDLILFTGTDSTEETVGHMGIIVSNVSDSITFIHSTSGKANGVTITPLNAYYRSRFVKVVRALQP